jgi:hypothetical protein
MRWYLCFVGVLLLLGMLAGCSSSSTTGGLPGPIEIGPNPVKDSVPPPFPKDNPPPP